MSEDQPLKGGKETIPLSVRKERRDYTVNLKISGISTDSIIKQINRLAPLKGWGTVTRATVEKDIATYFKENRVLNSNDFEHLDNLREAHLASMEKDIEQLVMYISKRDKQDENKTRPWKPFEKVSALETLHKMKMSFAEAQNWNLGRKNPLIAIQQNNVNNIYDRASNDLAYTQPEALQTVVTLLEGAMTSLKEDQELKEQAEKERVEAIITKANTNRDAKIQQAKERKAKGMEKAKQEVTSKLPVPLQREIKEMSEGELDEAI